MMVTVEPSLGETLTTDCRTQNVREEETIRDRFSSKLCHSQAVFLCCKMAIIIYIYLKKKKRKKKDRY